jgi:hypothetical protein
VRLLGGARVRITALVLWIAAACIGVYLLPAWLSRGGARQRGARVTGGAAAVVWLHPALAATGLGFWVAYILTAQAAMAWTAFGVMCGSALLAFAMLTRYLSGHGGRHARKAPPGLPGYAVAAHVAAGVVTFVLVLVTATMASQR